MHKSLLILLLLAGCGTLEVKTVELPSSVPPEEILVIEDNKSDYHKDIASTSMSTSIAMPYVSVEQEETFYDKKGHVVKRVKTKKYEVPKEPAPYVPPIQPFPGPTPDPNPYVEPNPPPSFWERIISDMTKLITALGGLFTAGGTMFLGYRKLKTTLKMA